MRGMLLVVLLSTAWSTCTFAQSTGVAFLPINLDDARQRANREDKLFFLYFSADWCMPCRWMEQHTFQDARISSYVASHYLPILVDVDEERNQRLQDQFEVNMLPTFLVFSARGSLIKRIETAMGPTALLDTLQRLNVSANHLQVRANKQNGYEVNETAPRPIVFTAPQLSPAPPPSRAITQQSFPVSNQFNSRSGDVYSIMTDIQHDLPSAQQKAAAIDNKYGYPSSIRAVEDRGRLAYQVIVGRFTKKSKAQEFLIYLNRNDIIGQIITLPAD